MNDKKMINKNDSEIVNKFISYLLNERNYSEHTIVKYEKVCYEYSKYLSTINSTIQDAKNEDVKNFIYQLYNLEYKAITISNYISVLKSLYKYLVYINFVSNNVMDNISYPKKENKLYKIIYTKELKSFFQAIEDNAKLKKRDEILFLILYSTGIRVSECSDLKISSINFDEGTLRVFGKGKKERIIPLKKEVLEKLENYILGERNIILKSKQSDFLFLNNRGDQITPRGIRYLTKLYCDKSSETLNVSPHNFRHTLATNLLNNGMNLRIIQAILGHESLVTTEKYTHLSKEELKNKYNSLIVRK